MNESFNDPYQEINTIFYDHPKKDELSNTQLQALRDTYAGTIHNKELEEQAHFVIDRLAEDTKTVGEAIDLWYQQKEADAKKVRDESMGAPSIETEPDEESMYKLIEGAEISSKDAAEMLEIALEDADELTQQQFKWAIPYMIEHKVSFSEAREVWLEEREKIDVPDISELTMGKDSVIRRPEDSEQIH